jgi:hypothetical protein
MHMHVFFVFAGTEPPQSPVGACTGCALINYPLITPAVLRQNKINGKNYRAACGLQLVNIWGIVSGRGVGVSGIANLRY